MFLVLLALILAGVVAFFFFRNRRIEQEIERQRREEEIERILERKKQEIEQHRTLGCLLGRMRFCYWLNCRKGYLKFSGSLLLCSELTKIRTRRRAADSTDSTARRGNAVLVFVNSLYFVVAHAFR